MPGSGTTRCTNFQPTPQRVAGGRAGFTLIELLVSIAIALVLVLGIHQVFRLTSDTVGAGQALASKSRDYRAVQSTLYNDLSMCVPPQSSNGAPMDDGPFFLIRSERVTMFRSRADQSADRDGDPATLDVDGDGVDGRANVPGENVRTTDINDRSHRIDRLMFFARGLFRRQTGGDVSSGGNSPMVSGMTSHEAFIWYGHLKLPDYTTPIGDGRLFAPRRPGEFVPANAPAGSPQPKNAQNFYASDWALGRVAVGLNEGSSPTGSGPGDIIVDARDVPQYFYRTFSGPSPLPPFRAAAAAGAQAVRSDDGWELEWSRYDVADTSIPQFRLGLEQYARRAGARPWPDLLAPLQFEADPLPRRPLTAAGAARAVPVFLSNCSQFAVEYAGDFVTQVSQNPYAGGSAPADEGAVLANQPDDAIDFVKLPDGSRNVRWYGLPRDTTGDGRVPGGRAKANDMPDVVPLRDVRRTARTRPPGEADEAPFERMADEQGRPRLPLPGGAGGDYAGSMAADATYVVAWGPDTVAAPRPLMLRMVFTLDDPTGRLASPQTYAYVIKLP